jgi:hypothetical protein
MPDDFGTMSMRHRAREIEILRQHYTRHRESLGRLVTDAPTEHLANEYQRLISEIDVSMRKLDEVEGKVAATTLADTNPAFKTGTAPGTTAPGTRPLLRTQEAAPSSGTSYEPTISTASQTRAAMIVIAGAVVLGLLVWLIWRASSDRRQQARPIVEAPAMTSTNAAPPPAVTPAPARAPALKITPAFADYGTIRKGTRAVRQFEIVNASSSPLTFMVARSGCRCLFYDYNGKLPAKGKETITVTVDAARAKPGPLQEQIEVTAKKNPSVNGSFTVQATIK